MGDSNLLYKAQCINPAHTDPGPSLAVYDDGHAYCYGCRQKFDRGPFPPPPVGVVVREARGPAYAGRLPRALADAYHDLLNSLFAPRREWLWGRGLTTATIDKYRLGHTGLAFTIPIWGDQFGEDLATIKYRRDDTLNPDGDRKYWGITGRNEARIFGLWQALRGRDVVLTEGELDALRLLQEPRRPFAVLTSTGGAHSWTAALAATLAGVRRIYLAFDQDAAGVAGARQAGRCLRQRGHAVFACRWDPAHGKDLTELLLRRGVDVFYDTLAMAGPV